MKKHVMTVVLAAVAAGAAWATPYEEILAAATANSPMMRNAELTYESGMLTVEQNNLDDTVSVMVSSGDVDFNLSGNGSPSSSSLQGVGFNLSGNGSPSSSSLQGVGSAGSDVSLSPSVTVVLPNDGETTITGGLGMGFRYGESYYSLAPSLSASHTFDLTGWDDEASSRINNSRTEIQTGLTYRQTVLAFENQVLTSIKSMVNAENSLAKARSQLEDARETLDNNLSLGRITEGSVAWRSQTNQISLLENSVAAYERSIEVAKQQYTTLTGLVWDGVEDLPGAVLTCEALPNGNTEVLVAGIDVKIAEQALADKLHQVNPAEVKLSGGVKGTASSDDNRISGNVGATYSAANWSVGAGLSGSYDDSKFSPALTVSGTWSNKTTARADELELQRLRNNLAAAQNSLTSAMTEYVQDIQNLQVRVLQQENAVSEQEATVAYLEADLANKEEMLAAGLVSEDTVQDARDELAWAAADTMSVHLDSLILANEIAQTNL